VLDDQQSQATGASSELLLKTIKIAPVAPGDEVFTIALASNGELPDPASVALIGEPFEVRWWEQKLDQAAGERDRALSDRDRAGAGRDSARAERDLERKEQGAALLEVEAELAQAHDRIAQLSSSAADLEQWSVEQLGERDMLLGEREQESLDYKNRLGRAEATIEDVTTSISWRLTRPLRAVKKLLG
jgi:hypothetical protein